jgi:8-oxo-dGTP pyrophosphatase MutT (NUDIX family)
MRTNKRVGAVIKRENKVLLIHRFKNGDEYWVLPGGGVEDEESLEEALKREVFEETGLELIGFESLGSDESGDHHHYYYDCKVSVGEPQLGGPEKDNSSAENIYILEWVEILNISKLNVYPDGVKKYL